MFSTNSGNGSGAYAAYLKTGQYIGKLVRLEPFTSEFKDERTGEPKQRIKWVWYLAAQDSPAQPIKTDKDEVFEFYSYSGIATGEKSTAGPWITCLLGRPVKPGENGDALAQQLIGKKALLWIKQETVPGEHGQEPRARLKLVDIDTYAPGANGTAAKAPEPTPEPVLAGAAAGANDIPF